MTIDEIKQEIIDQGRDPEDFDIIITENGYAVTPKWFTETKWIARNEDRALGIELTDRELESIELGQQLTDLELRILELEMRVL